MTKPRYFISGYDEYNRILVKDRQTNTIKNFGKFCEDNPEVQIETIMGLQSILEEIAIQKMLNEWNLVPVSGDIDEKA